MCENIKKREENFSDCAYCEPIFTSCVKRTPQINLKKQKKEQSWQIFE